jgi:hypothetical protein
VGRRASLASLWSVSNKAATNRTSILPRYRGVKWTFAGSSTRHPLQASGRA